MHPISGQYEIFLRTKILHVPIFVAILETLHSTHGKELLITETEKSEQTLFAQISQPQY